EGEAGSGGMGTVYRALDRHSGAAVAVKVLRAQGEVDVERFLREASVLAELEHPGIVRYVAHRAPRSGAAYLAMEWLEGETLADRLTHKRLTIGEAAIVALRVAEALAVAHRRGVVHRDIKPSNLFLPGGELTKVKLVDFGIARVARHVRQL